MDAMAIIAVIPVLLIAAFVVMIARRGMLDRERMRPRDIAGLVPVMVILLVSVMLVGSFVSPNEKEEEEADYEIYDCVPLADFGSGATVVGDCAEKVTIDGTDYVRMTSVGSFTVASEDSQTEYTVGKAHMDLVMFSGQSNATAFTAPSLYEGGATVSPGEAFYIGLESIHSDTYGGQLRENTIDNAGNKICDLVADDGSLRLAGMYPSFCGDYCSETGHRLMTVSTAITGMSLGGWDEGGRADVLMESALDLLEELCEGKIELTPVAVLWVQGEQNSSSTVDYYLERFGALCEKLEDGYYGYSFPHITSSLPRTSMRPYDNMINPALAQIAYAEQDPHFTVATSIAYRATEAQYRDGVHFQQEYYNWAGEAFARQVAVLTGFEPVDETIVLAEGIGTVTELPSIVTAYGTSGASFELSVAWTETETAGAYSGTLSGNPAGTRILSGLTASATLTT